MGMICSSQIHAGPCKQFLPFLAALKPIMTSTLQALPSAWMANYLICGFKSEDWKEVKLIIICTTCCPQLLICNCAQCRRMESSFKSRELNPWREFTMPSEHVIGFLTAPSLRVGPTAMFGSPALVFPHPLLLPFPSSPMFKSECDQALKD